MSLRRRLVVGMLVLLVLGLLTIDVVTSSSLRSFLLGRLDEQIDASQNQAYTYISQVYQRDVQSGNRTPVTDPGRWLAELGAKAPPGGGRFTSGPRPDPRLSGTAFTARISDDAYVEVLVDRAAQSSSGSPRVRPGTPIPPRRCLRCFPSSSSPPSTSSARTTARTRPRAPRSTWPRRGHRVTSTGCTPWPCRAAPS